MNNKTILIAGAIVLVLAGAGAGFLGARFLGTQPTGIVRGAGGGFAQLTDAERRSLQSMTEEERTAFFKEKGIDMPSGGPGMPGPDGTAGGTGMRGRFGALLQGTVAALDAETLTVELTAGGSQKVYLDDDTVNAAEDGAGELAVGSSVMVSAQPEADGVNGAELIVVLK